MDTWSTRIKYRMKELNMTQEQLAESMQLTRSAITHYLAGRREPPLKQFQKLADILKTNPAWLIYGASPISTDPILMPSIPVKTILPMITPRKKLIPIMSWEEAAEFMDVSRLRQSDTREFIAYFYTEKSRWYALRIKDDAMTAQLGPGKSFYEGDMIIIDPDKLATPGDYIIALLPRAKEATFKQYVVDGGVHFLKPLNSQYPLITFDKNTYVCGVVVACLHALT